MAFLVQGGVDGVFPCLTIGLGLTERGITRLKTVVGKPPLFIVISAVHIRRIGPRAIVGQLWFSPPRGVIGHLSSGTVLELEPLFSFQGPLQAPVWGRIVLNLRVLVTLERGVQTVWYGGVGYRG